MTNGTKTQDARAAAAPRSGQFEQKYAELTIYQQRRPSKTAANNLPKK
jgi:hypothetical protein